MPPSTRRWVAWLPAVLWAATIFVLSSQPALSTPGGIGDKPAHAVAFGILALCCAFGLAGGTLLRVTTRQLVGAFVLTVLYGASDEWHQGFVPGRTPDLRDIAADAAGAIVALSTLALWAILLGRRALDPRRQ